MYVQTTLFFPGIGKAPELRTLLEEQVRKAQSEGHRVGLQLALYAPNAPAFRLGRQFENLGQLEAFRAIPLDAAFGARITPLFREPVRNALWEQLLAAPGPGGDPPRYVQRFVNRPLPGKGPELAALVVENARRAAGEGVRGGVMVQVAGPAAGSVVRFATYGSLMELEKRREINRTNPALQEFQAKLAGLLEATSISTISEVLVTLPPR